MPPSDDLAPEPLLAEEDEDADTRAVFAQRRRLIAGALAGVALAACDRGASPAGPDDAAPRQHVVIPAPERREDAAKEGAERDASAPDAGNDAAARTPEAGIPPKPKGTPPAPPRPPRDPSHCPSVF